MDYNYLADLLFPSVTLTPEDMEKRYPPRNLPEGAKVTRFAPSPTGFLHFGGLFPTRVGERLAHQSGGVFYLRIEDTDAKREVEGAEESLISTLKHYGIEFDEGATANGGHKGDYGPYRQRQRKDIYHVYAKYLVQQGLAYPCFCTEEELDEIRKEQEALKVDPGYYGKWAKYRDADISVIEENLKAGKPFVLRFRSNGSVNNKVKFTDLIKGDLELTENDKDHIILKSDGIPNYHFAHAVDDHLMRTTHVIRGEEWLPSLPFHIQLFKALGFKLPKYLHIAQLMKLENGSKKKLSKRDAGADVRYYDQIGYDPECVIEYIMTLLNSNYEEWRTANPQKAYTEFPFSIKKMSNSGCLFDFDKLNDVTKNTVSLMSAEKVYGKLTEWAETYDPSFAELLKRDAKYATDILAIGRGGAKPRKDICTWSGVKDYMGFFYDELFVPSAEFPANIAKEDIAAIIAEYPSVYDENDDQQTWFAKLKELAEKHGFAADTKAYKLEPGKYKGHVGDIAMILRIAITGKQVSPDTYQVMKIMGRDRVLRRLSEVRI